MTTTTTTQQTTTIPEPSQAPETKRRTATFGREDVLALVGALAAGISFASILFAWLVPLSGAVGFVVLCYVSFIAFYALLSWIDHDGPAVRDRLVAAFVHGTAVLLFVTLASVIIFTVARAVTVLHYHNFFTQDLHLTGPLQPLTSGGVTHGMIGTLEQITIALIITVPLGLLCAVFLNEVPGRLARVVRTVAEAATALPSIVAGLFIYATLEINGILPKSGFAAALAISVMMLPIIIRAADVVLRLVPGNLKEASYALGASQWRTVWTVTLPTARSGLATAVILGTARGIGETSPVLLTAGYGPFYNSNPFHGPQTSLPLLVFKLVTLPDKTMIERGFGAATVLLALVLLLFLAARAIGGRAAGQLSPRQRRRRTAASKRDLVRFAGHVPPAEAGPSEREVRA